MEFDIDGLIIGGNTNFKLTPTITGLGKPGIRMGSGQFGGRDGGYVSSQYYDMRIVNIPGHYLGDDCDDAEALRAQLNAIPIRKLLPIFITTFTGQKWFTEGYINDLKNEIEAATDGAFNIQLVCPDPYLYDAGDGTDPNSGYIEQEFYKIGGGGYTTPYSLPVTWTPGQTPAQVENTGDIYIYPQLVLNGAYTNPRITNVTTGAFIELNVTTAPGQEIIIDMKKRTITLDGGSVAAYRTDDSSWWFLQPGVNVILLNSDSGSDEETGIIRYRPGIEGI